VELPDGLLGLLRQPAPCFISTLMPDGSPQLTQVWVDTDGEHVLVNSPEHTQKVRNVRRDPRVAVNVADPAAPARYYALRGRVLDVTKDGAAEHIETLSHRYLGKPYPMWGGPDQVRVIMTIEVDHISG
jgi:PPOX class probable F420-dependent enzyme